MWLTLLSGVQTPALAERATTPDVQVMGAPAEPALQSPPKDTQIIRRVLEVDSARATSSLPNDPYATAQWNFMAPEKYAGAANLFNTPINNASTAQVVVAIVDSGLLLDHEDYVTLDGYDFVHDPVIGNDGDGRDNDPADPGDWVNASDISNHYVADSCQITTSKWHGTAIAGIVGAISENQLGVAGGASNAALLPVRVTGKCGGYVKDLIDGIRWAAGLSVPGVPDNPTPARIINLSVGFPGQCSSRLQSTINEAVNAGAILVTAATNNPVSLDSKPYSPASCNNILSIGAALRNGLLADYSARGSNLFLLGPGGSAKDGIVSTDNSGHEMAQSGDNYGYHFGTSLAAAHVSAALATLLSIDPSLNNTMLEQLLIRSASSTTNDPQCDNSCGYGKLNTNRAVKMLIDQDLPITTLQNDNPISDNTIGDNPINDNNGATTTPPVAAANEGGNAGTGTSAPGLILVLLTLTCLRRLHSGKLRAEV